MTVMTVILVTSMPGNFKCVCVCVCGNFQCHDIHTKFHEIAFTVATIMRTGNKVLSPGELPASPVDPALQ